MAFPFGIHWGQGHFSAASPSLQHHPAPQTFPQHNSIYTPEIPSLYTFQKKGKKAQLCFQMAFQDARVGTLGNVWECPHAAGGALWDHLPTHPRTNNSPALKWHSLNMQMSQLISRKFPINYDSLSVSLLVSDVRFQGYSLAQMLGEKWSVNIYGLKGETLEPEDLSLCFSQAASPHPSLGACFGDRQMLYMHTYQLPLANSASSAQNIKYLTHAQLEQKILFSRKSFALYFLQVWHFIHSSPAFLHKAGIGTSQSQAHSA